MKKRKGGIKGIDVGPDLDQQGFTGINEMMLLCVDGIDPDLVHEWGWGKLFKFNYKFRFNWLVSQYNIAKSKKSIGFSERFRSWGVETTYKILYSEA